MIMWFYVPYDDICLYNDDRVVMMFFHMIAWYHSLMLLLWSWYDD